MEIMRAFGIFFFKRVFIFDVFPNSIMRLHAVCPSVVRILYHHVHIDFKYRKKVDENVKIWYSIELGWVEANLNAALSKLAFDDKAQETIK